MLHTGLVSITFRNLSPTEIVALAAQAGLEGVEWGGDVHVPPGDLGKAREVGRMTEDAGLAVAAYGSYYVVNSMRQTPFEAVLETAVALKAPTIRVWAGEKGSDLADREYFGKTVSETRRIAGLAAEAGITISYEFHARTLTDTNASALKLLSEVSHDNVRTYWQPPVGADRNYALEGLKNILPWLGNVHAFYWGAKAERHPLADGTNFWADCLRAIASSGRDHFVMIEFVKDDDRDNFLRDAETLKSWLLSPGTSPSTG